MPSSPLTMYAMQAYAGVNPLPVIPWSMAGVIAVWLCLAHTRYWSLRFLGRNLGSRPPVWKRRLITGSFAALIAPLLLAILAGQWVSSVPAAISGSQQDTAFMGPLLIGGFLVLTVLLVAAAFAAFGVLWFGLGLLNAADAAGCHACRAPWTQKPSVGTFCQSCGEPAGGWLLVTVKGSVSTSETG